MNKGRILVVEDDFDISNMLRIYFSGQGFEVGVAPRGGDALEMTRKGLPNLILLDIMLPDMDGFEVCKALRTTTRTSSPPRRREDRQQSMAVLPPPRTMTRLPMVVVWPNDTEESQSMPMWMFFAASLRSYSALAARTCSLRSGPTSRKCRSARFAVEPSNSFVNRIAPVGHGSTHRAQNMHLL